MDDKPKVVSYGPSSTTYEIDGNQFTVNHHDQRIPFAQVPNLEERNRLTMEWLTQLPK